MSVPPKRLAVFQMHHTDVVEGLERWNAVERMRDAGVADRVALAAADVPENEVLRPWAERWGVPLFLGAERDVARRLLDCADAEGCGTLARGLTWWFFQDLGLVRAQFELLEESACELVDLPRDFDLRFGADVFTRGFLEHVLTRMEELDPGTPLRQSPWGFVETHPEDFEVCTFEEVPVYDRATFDEVAAGVRALWPERWDGAATPLHPYRVATRRLGAGDRVLDVACGLGAGSALLADHGCEVLGVDADAGAVEAARRRYGDRVRFEAGDALALDLEPGSFDAVVSVHTMEHLADDRAFLAAARSWLRKEGELILEVPLLARRPFLGIEDPLSPCHEREYALDGLMELVAESFAPLQVFGVSRGAYVEAERARSAVLVRARPL